MSARVVIIGGGAIGSAIAYFLRLRGDQAEVTVVERDPTYARASSALSASSIRQQFSTPANILISQFGIGFLRGIGETLAADGERPDIGLREPGDLFLATARGRPVLEANHATQRAHGASVALLEPTALRARFPWLAVDDLAAGSLGLAGEGWFDGYGLLQAFRRKARALGARYLAAEAVAIEQGAGRAQAVRLGDGTALAADWVVNAGGPWAAAVAAMAGIDLPVRARRRSVFVFDCRETLPDFPLLIDPSGLWVRPEGAHFITGISPPADQDPDDQPLEVEHAVFEETLWPTLAERVPAFAAIKPVNAWAGYYEMNTFDHNAIIGPHPGLPNLLFANGFSGHGIQQSPAVGRGVAELILDGGYRSLDLSPFAFTRILENRPIRELNVV